MRKIIAVGIAAIALTGCNQATDAAKSTTSTTTVTATATHTPVPTTSAPSTTTTSATPSTTTSSTTTAAPTSSPATTANAAHANSAYVASFNHNANGIGPKATSDSDKATIIGYGRALCAALKGGDLTTATQSLTDSDGNPLDPSLARIVALAATDKGSICPV